MFEVGEKYIVYGYEGGSDKSYPSVYPEKRFRKYFELVITCKHKHSPSIKVEDCPNPEMLLIVHKNSKPYLYKNPNNDHWICSKHGDLDLKDDLIIVSNANLVIICGTTYCFECFWDAGKVLINEHITGVEK